MKQIFVLFMFCMIGTANATSSGGVIPIPPSTTCPSGWITINAEHIIVPVESQSSDCTYVGPADSCLETDKLPSISSCIMYVPAGKKYRDETGTYEYEYPCLLK